MSAAVMEHSQATVTIAHPLGQIEVSGEAIMRFTTPMLGFEATDFALLPAARKGLWWFVSTGDTPTTFVLADPFVTSADYGVDLNESERSELGLVDEADALVLVLLVMPTVPGQPVTGNFRAPLVFNLAARLVKQVVITDDEYSLAQPVDLQLYALEAEDPAGSDA